MPVLIKCVGHPGINPDGERQPNINGCYLKAYDLEYMDGRGTAEWTRNWRDAMQFDDDIAAFEAWRSSPRARPLRDDGKPNRPLTAFSITLVNAP